MLSMVACACPGIGPAKDAGGATAENPENFRLEITGAGWLVNPSGTIQSSGTPVNLVTDLGAQPHQATFYGQLVFKPDASIGSWLKALRSGSMVTTL